MIARGLEGALNVLIHYKVIEGKIGATASSNKTYIGNAISSIRATTGGFAEVFVKPGDTVKAGQEVALQRNAFGDVVAKYSAERDGKVLAIGTDVVREPRALLVRVLSKTQPQPAKTAADYRHSPSLNRQKQLIVISSISSPAGEAPPGMRALLLRKLIATILPDAPASSPDIHAAAR